MPMHLLLDKHSDSHGVVRGFPLSSPHARKPRPNSCRRFSRETREEDGTGEAKSGVARSIKRGIKTPAIYGPSASREIIVIGDIPWRRGATRGQLAGAIKELRRAPCSWVSPFSPGFRGRPARFKAGRSQSQRIAKDSSLPRLRNIQIYIFFFLFCEIFKSLELFNQPCLITWNLPAIYLEQDLC